MLSFLWDDAYKITLARDLSGTLPKITTKRNCFHYCFYCKYVSDVIAKLFVQFVFIMSCVTGRYIITHRTLGNFRSPRHTGNKSKKYNVGKPKKKPQNPNNIKKQTKKKQLQTNNNTNNNNNNNNTCAITITTTTIIIIIFKI